MWVIEATSRKGHKIYRADNRKCPDRYWSYNIAHAFLYQKEDFAVKECSKYKFGNPKVKEINEADKLAISFYNLCLN